MENWEPPIVGSGRGGVASAEDVFKRTRELNV
jgi:hypothetical protein